MKSHGLVGSSSCPIGWMDDLYALAVDADKVLTFWPHRVVVWVATRYGIVAKLRQEVFLDVPELVSRRPTERP